MKSISAINLAITENTENYAREMHAPKIIYWKTHNHSTLHTQLCFVRYTAKQAKCSMKSISAIHPAITENMENILVKRTPHISIRDMATHLTPDYV